MRSARPRATRGGSRDWTSCGSSTSRPRRRNVRHLDPGAGRRNLRGESDGRRHVPGGRGLRQEDHGLAPRRLPEVRRHRSEAGPHGAAAPCLDALASAKMQPSDVDQVILVGGQTRTPKVQRMVAELFGRDPSREINPDEVVAIGAAIQGGVLKGEIKEVVLLDVTPLSLGIETHGGLFEKLIERNSTIPTKNTKVFTTVADNQSVVEIHVLQGERELARENKSLGRFELVGLPTAPRGVPQIEVTFAIDSNGIVHVSARDLATGKAQGMQLNPAGGLSKSEIDRIIREAETFAAADNDRRELAQMRNRLEGMLSSNERVLTEFSSALAPDERERIEETLLRSREIASSESRDELNEALFDMQGVSKVLTRVMLQRAAAGA